MQLHNGQSYGSSAVKSLDVQQYTQNGAKNNKSGSNSFVAIDALLMSEVRGHGRTGSSSQEGYCK